MMVVVARTLFHIHSLSFSFISPYSLCLLFIVFCIMCMRPPIARSLLLSVHLWLSQHNALRHALRHLPLANSCE